MGEVQELNCGIEAKRQPEGGTQHLLLPGGDAGGVWGGEKPSFLFLYGGRVWGYSLIHKQSAAKTYVPLAEDK